VVGDIYFISDAHLGSADRVREKIKEERLLSFIGSLQSKAEALYIVGDLFDFWFEYRSVASQKNPRVLFELYNLIKSGTKVVYLGGNHDFWLGSFLSEGVGAEISKGPIHARHHGLQIYVSHGDEFCEKDPGTRILRRILRSPVSISLFRLIHPDLGAILARLISRSSRGPSVLPSDLKAVCIEAAHRMFSNGFDAVVIGHIHLPFILHQGERTVIILGDWIRHFSYAVLHNGKFTLRRW